MRLRSIFLSAATTLLAMGFLQYAHAECAVNDILVNSCRPWFAVAAGGYPEVASDTKSQILYFEQRLGKQIDIVHTYHKPSKDALSPEEVYFINRPGTYLATTWKPTLTWKEAGGGNAEVNASIDRMAKSIKAVAPKKIFLSIFHEPENDVSGGAAQCEASIYKGDAGTPADYRLMWKNIRNRFDQLHVTNVVWTMNYMGFGRWDCMVDDLWPGNDLVDWIVWDPYMPGKMSWPESPMRLYTLLSNNSNKEHNYLSKPWGIMETGSSGPDREHILAQYANMITSLHENTMPKLKMLAVWDHYTAKSTDNRVGYDSTTHQPDPDKQKAFNAYATDPRFTDAFYNRK